MISPVPRFINISDTILLEFFSADLTYTGMKAFLAYTIPLEYLY